LKLGKRSGFRLFGAAGVLAGSGAFTWNFVTFEIRAVD
jgi:hypothetical protein